MVTRKLKMSEGQYETIIISIWTHWCRRYSYSIPTAQKLMCNQPLFTWWKRQLQQLENEFLEDIAHYPDLAPLDAETIYMRTVHKIYGIYSKPLIKKALHNDSKTNHKQN